MSIAATTSVPLGTKVMSAGTGRPGDDGVVGDNATISDDGASFGQLFRHTLRAHGANADSNAVASKNAETAADALSTAADDAVVEASSAQPEPIRRAAEPDSPEQPAPPAVVLVAVVPPIVVPPIVVQASVVPEADPSPANDQTVAESSSAAFFAPTAAEPPAPAAVGRIVVTAIEAVAATSTVAPETAQPGVATALPSASNDSVTEVRRAESAATSDAGQADAGQADSERSNASEQAETSALGHVVAVQPKRSGLVSATSIGATADDAVLAAGADAEPVAGADAEPVADAAPDGDAAPGGASSLDRVSPTAGTRLSASGQDLELAVTNPGPTAGEGRQAVATGHLRDRTGIAGLPTTLGDIRVDLSDEGLGPLTLRARSGTDGLQLKLTSADPFVGEMLARASGELRRELEANGAAVRSLDVGHSNVGSRGTNPGQYQGAGPDHRDNESRQAASGNARAGVDDSARTSRQLLTISNMASHRMGLTADGVDVRM